MCRIVSWAGATIIGVDRCWLYLTNLVINLLLVILKILTDVNWRCTEGVVSRLNLSFSYNSVCRGTRPYLVVLGHLRLDLRIDLNSAAQLRIRSNYTLVRFISNSLVISINLTVRLRSVPRLAKCLLELCFAYSV